MALSIALSFSQNLQAFDFDRSLSSNERLIIEDDLNNLCRLDYNLPFAGKQALEQHLRRLMGIQEVNCQQLQAFLRDHIQVITKGIADDSIFLDSGGADSATQILANEAIAKIVGQERSRTINSDSIANSLGTALYIKMKSPRKINYLPPQLAAQDLDFSFRYLTPEPQAESKTLPITPHQSIIMVGDSFFLSATHPNPENQNSVSNSIYRISVLLHEARHPTDQIYFVHTPCRGGALVCDNAPDGPYTIESVFAYYAWNLCALSNQCSAQELVKLNYHVWVALQQIESHSMALREPLNYLFQYLLPPDPDQASYVSGELSPRAAIDHPAMRELFLGRPLASAELVADILRQTVLPGSALSPNSPRVQEMTQLLNRRPLEILHSLIPLTDLRGPLALPLNEDKHFAATTVEALDYSRKMLLLTRVLRAVQNPPWRIPFNLDRFRRLRTFIYGHSYDDEWKRELQSQLQNSPQWQEALGAAPL